MTVMQKTNTIDLTRLKQGQVITRKYFELSDRISLIFGSPKTDFIHYAIIAVPIKNRDDCLTFNEKTRTPCGLCRRDELSEAMYIV
jgi:hypothetical protein